jgi:hypothetical protein
MCFVNTPDVRTPAPPPAPTRQDEAVVASQEEERRRAAQARGRRATILTGGLGDPSFGQNTQNRTLLGAS